MYNKSCHDLIRDGENANKIVEGVIYGATGNLWQGKAPSSPTLKTTGRQWRQTDIRLKSLTLLGIIMNQLGMSRRGKGRLSRCG